MPSWRIRPVTALDRRFAAVFRANLPDTERLSAEEIVAAINRRAEAVVALVNAIKTDTANILTFVVSIERSAKSIDSKAPKLLLF